MFAAMKLKANSFFFEVANTSCMCEEKVHSAFIGFLGKLTGARQLEGYDSVPKLFGNLNFQPKNQTGTVFAYTNSPLKGHNNTWE